MIAESCNVFSPDDENIDWGDLTDHPIKSFGFFTSYEGAQAKADEENKNNGGEEKYFVIEIGFGTKE